MFQPFFQYLSDVSARFNVRYRYVVKWKHFLISFEALNMNRSAAGCDLPAIQSGLETPSWYSKSCQHMIQL